ncbi:MAG TPA: substrate-binding domain-containing protein [Pyrinomonadaceae bacterium]|nr:substrate-binding domain-containing protein [Pyrinomonadaceae bacterium]
MLKNNLRISLSSLSCTLFADFPAAPSHTFAARGEVRVLSADGMRQVMLDLGPKFERATGHKLKVSFDSSGVILKRLERGEPVDVLMTNQPVIERLAAADVKASVSDVAMSEIRFLRL